MLVYLDQNHASRIAKFLRGQPGHDAFGRAYEALQEVRPCVPPSPFHVLETRGGYLLPTLRTLFEDLSGGWWVRPYQEVVARQAKRRTIAREDLLTGRGGWSEAATLHPLDDLLDAPLEGTFGERAAAVRERAARRFGLAPEPAAALPFFRLLGRLVAFRSLDEERASQAGDLTDLTMAATVAPYVDVLATDRYVRESLVRIGHRGRVHSGRRPDVERLAVALRGDSGRRSGPACGEGSRGTPGPRACSNEP